MPYLQDFMTLKTAYGPKTILKLQQDMVYGLNFVVHVVLKVDTHVRLSGKACCSVSSQGEEVEYYFSCCCTPLMAPTSLLASFCSHAAGMDYEAEGS